MACQSALPGSAVVMCHHSRVTGAAAALADAAALAGVLAAGVLACADGEAVPPLEHADNVRAMSARTLAARHRDRISGALMTYLHLIPNDRRLRLDRVEAATPPAQSPGRSPGDGPCRGGSVPRLSVVVRPPTWSEAP